MFVTCNDFHRDNFKPYVLKSGDLGRTWTPIAGDLPQRDPAWTIVQDHVKPDLLFLGTEFGLSFTTDGGRHWIAIKGGMPVIPIRDLEIQKRESDLVAASFGRGFFVLDDYSPLRQIGPETLATEAALFAPARKARVYEEIGYYRAQGDNIASPMRRPIAERRTASRGVGPAGIAAARAASGPGAASADRQRTPRQRLRRPRAVEAAPGSPEAGASRARVRWSSRGFIRCRWGGWWTAFLRPWGGRKRSRSRRSSGRARYFNGSGRTRMP